VSICPIRPIRSPIVSQTPKDNERNQEQRVSLIPFIFAIPDLKLASIGFRFCKRPYTSKQETQPNRNQNKISLDFGLWILDFGMLLYVLSYSAIRNPKSEIAYFIQLYLRRTRHSHRTSRESLNPP
jgi:hypothetical protein